MEVIIIISILIVAILTFFNIIPTKKWYHILKSKSFGTITRVKIKVMSFFYSIF